MACDEFVKGHLFCFDTGTCKRCAMHRARFEALGEPPCPMRTRQETEPQADAQGRQR